MVLLTEFRSRQPRATSARPMQAPSPTVGVRCSHAVVFSGLWKHVFKEAAFYHFSCLLCLWRLAFVASSRRNAAFGSVKRVMNVRRAALFASGCTMYFTLCKTSGGIRRALHERRGVRLESCKVGAGCESASLALDTASSLLCAGAFSNDWATKLLNYQ